MSLDNSINYIRPVKADRLINMFPDIVSENDFIQFETGDKLN